MSEHREKPSPPAKTYSAQPPIAGHRLSCTRCGREYPYPPPGGQSVFCECGWRYANVKGRIEEEFRIRL